MERSLFNHRSLGVSFSFWLNQTHRTEHRERKQKKNKQMRWRTIEYKDENCTRKKWYHRFVNQFLFSPKTVTILWKCDGRFNSDLYERFHIEKVCGPRGMSRMNLTVLNVHISQRTNRHAHICEPHTETSFISFEQQTNCNVSWLKEGKVTFVWKFLGWIEYCRTLTNVVFSVKNYTLLQWQCDGVSSPLCDVINLRKRKEEEKKWLKLIATREENDLVIANGNVQLVFFLLENWSAYASTTFAIAEETRKNTWNTIVRLHKITLFSFKFVELSKICANISN